MVRKYKFRSNSDLCLPGDLRQMLPGVIAYVILFDLNLYGVRGGGAAARGGLGRTTRVVARPAGRPEATNQGTNTGTICRSAETPLALS